jgi:trimeric autotransporter adhesin
MNNSKRNLSLLCGIAALVVLVIGAGCTGFFVNQPNSVTVAPSTLSIAQGATGQLQATAAFNSGSKDVTKSASWTSSSPCATVSQGVVTGVGPTTNVTITANVAGVSGTATVTVTGAQGITIITVSPANQTFTAATTPSQQFTATQNGVDVTNSATWTSGNTSVVTFSSTTPGLATFVGTGTTTITASVTSGNSCASGSTNVTVQ